MSIQHEAAAQMKRLQAAVRASRGAQAKGVLQHRSRRVRKLRLNGFEVAQACGDKTSINLRLCEKVSVEALTA